MSGARTRLNFRSTYCRTNFVRAVQTIEVSIDVMWEFVSNQLPQKNFVKWWKDNTQPSGPPWKIKIIKENPPMKWDVSVLCHAILSCKDPGLKLNKSQKKSVEKLGEIRNKKLFHRSAAQIDFEEYVEVLRESMESYKGLLDEDHRLLHVKRLEDINNREIYILYVKVLCAALITKPR